MENYNKTVEQTAVDVGADVNLGLTSAQAAERLQTVGRNAFEKQKKRSLASRIFAQLKDVSTIILIIAGVLSLTMAIIEGGGYFECIVVFAVIIMNVILAVTQEKSAEDALEALGSLSSPICRVLRDGEVKEIDPEELVPGDIIMLKTGDLVPADARLIAGESLAVDESSLKRTPPRSFRAKCPSATGSIACSRAASSPRATPKP